MRERTQIYETIVQTIRTLLTERNDPVPELRPETRISASGLDSLDVAALVVRLEDRLGVDPFKDATLTRYPQTLGEMAALYAQRSDPVES
jgi:acyl carrier protein